MSPETILTRDRNSGPDLKKSSFRDVCASTTIKDADYLCFIVGHF